MDSFKCLHGHPLFLKLEKKSQRQDLHRNTLSSMKKNEFYNRLDRAKPSKKVTSINRVEHPRGLPRVDFSLIKSKQFPIAFQEFIHILIRHGDIGVIVY